MHHLLDFHFKNLLKSICQLLYLHLHHIVAEPVLAFLGNETKIQNLGTELAHLSNHLPSIWPHMIQTNTMRAYLEAGVATKAFTIDGVRGDPFMNDDQPTT